MNNIGSDINANLPLEAISSDFFAMVGERRGKIHQVKHAINNLITNARSDQEFVGSLGKFWGDNSRHNSQLKSILNRSPLRYTPKHSYVDTAHRMKREAKEVIYLVKKGFAQIRKPVPQEINRDIVQLKSALHEMFKGVAE